MPAPATAPGVEALPRITVLTPSFNQAETLAATLDSVLDQGYPNLEYIVIDGGSTDGSVEILEKYADRLAWWVSERDVGHGDALDKGFARSTGEVMGWINSDDLLLPGSLRLVGRLFDRFPEMEWLTSPGTVLDPEGSIVEPLAPFRWTRQKFLATHDRFIQQESTFWRHSLWEKAGAHVSKEHLACDFELWARFFRHARLYQTRALIGAFRHRAEQRSVQQRERYLTEVRAILEREEANLAWFSLPDAEAEVFSEIRFNVGNMSFQRHDSRDLMGVAESTIVLIEPPLDGQLVLVGLFPPSWGLEQSLALRTLLPELGRREPRNFTLLWLGSGPAEGLRLALHSARPQAVEVQFVTAPGPSRTDRSRTVALALRSQHGREQRELRAFESEQLLSWRVELDSGRHELSIAVLDQANVGVLPNGDTRRLMAVISALRMIPLATPPPH